MYVIEGGQSSSTARHRVEASSLFCFVCLFVKFAEKSSFVSMHIIFLQRIVVETSLV